MEGLLAQRYQLETVVGSGGMGTVWRAQDILLDRQVAIKEVRYSTLLNDAERQELTTRAVAEARHAARLEHARIVPIYDVLIHDERPWIVMRYIPGRSLEQQVIEAGRLSPDEVRRIGRGLLEALAAAHRGGVLHRDVKPSNVLLTDDGEPMLTDFSIARAIGQGTATNTGLIVGSPGYIAPERVVNGVAGPEADLFGLGATLFFAVEGVAPFAHQDAMAGAFAAAIHPHPRPQHAGPTLTTLLDGLLEKDPRARLTFAAAAQLLNPQAPPAAPEPAPAATGFLGPPAAPEPPGPSSVAADTAPPQLPPPPLPTPVSAAGSPSPHTPPPVPAAGSPSPQASPPTPTPPSSLAQPATPSLAPPSAATGSSPWTSHSPSPAGSLPPPGSAATGASPWTSHPSPPTGSTPPFAPSPAAPPWVSSLPSAQPDTLEEQGAFAAGRAEAVIATPVPGEEMAEPTGSGTWVAGRIALVAATVVALALVVVGIGKAAFWSAQGGAATTSATPSVTARPSASPSVTPTAATATPTPPPTASAKTTAPRTSAPSTSPFFTPELKAFGAGWQSGLRCTSHHDSPARAIDATSCSLSPSAIPDVTKNASRSVTVFLEQFLPGAADDYLGCTPTYTIPGMVGKVDNPGTSGNRAGFYCETTGNLSDNGSLVGMCTYIMWTSGDVRMLGMVYQCFRFSDEGANFKPTPAMLSYLRSLWNARA